MGLCNVHNCSSKRPWTVEPAMPVPIAFAKQSAIVASESLAKICVLRFDRMLSSATVVLMQVTDVNGSILNVQYHHTRAQYLSTTKRTIITYNPGRDPTSTNTIDARPVLHLIRTYYKSNEPSITQVDIKVHLAALHIRESLSQRLQCLQKACSSLPIFSARSTLILSTKLCS
jgi:hypothetical protein